MRNLNLWKCQTVGYLRCSCLDAFLVNLNNVTDRALSASKPSVYSPLGKHNHLSSTKA